MQIINIAINYNHSSVYQTNTTYPIATLHIGFKIKHNHETLKYSYKDQKIH